jgi:predicted SAM-dependent methyltransferase
MKLHLGCGKNIKPNYINIDAFEKGDAITNVDIFNMPYEDRSVDEIVCEHMIEHIKFKDEEVFWREIYRLLRPGGVAIIEAPDMEWLCTQFLAAQDAFSEFYQVGAKDHYFGHGRSIEHRWGMITTHFFGNQNGDGQFHYNAYTKQKFESIGRLLGFKSCEVQKILNKGAQCLVARFIK